MEVAALSNWLRRLFTQPDRYEWLSGYLVATSLRCFARIAMGLIVLTGSLVVAVMTHSAAGPASTPEVAASWVVVVVSAGAGFSWLTHWPGRRESTVLVVLLDISIAVACLVQSDPLAGALGGVVFALLAGFVAFFHSSRYVLAVVASAAATSVVLAARVADLVDPALAFCVFVGVTANAAVLPVAVHILVPLLSVDSMESSVDPLTKVLNRRGFVTTTQRWVTEAIEPVTVSVILIDIDGFKQINDTRGHAEGDRLLVAIGATLRAQVGDDVIAARYGGEEFVLAGRLRTAAALQLAEQVRAEVAALPHSATVSIGVSTGTLSGTDDLRSALDRLVRGADDAMYDAKRAGGDRVRHHVRATEPC